MLPTDAGWSVFKLPNKATGKVIKGKPNSSKDDIAKLKTKVTKQENVNNKGRIILQINNMNESSSVGMTLIPSDDGWVERPVNQNVSKSRTGKGKFVENFQPARVLTVSKKRMKPDVNKKLLKK